MKYIVDKVSEMSKMKLYSEEFREEVELGITPEDAAYLAGHIEGYYGDTSSDLYQFLKEFIRSGIGEETDEHIIGSYEFNKSFSFLFRKWDEADYQLICTIEEKGKKFGFEFTQHGRKVFYEAKFGINPSDGQSE